MAQLTIENEHSCLCQASFEMQGTFVICLPSFCLC